MYLMLWKQTKIQFVRRIRSTLVVLLLPVAFFGLLIWLRTEMAPKNNYIIDLNTTIKDTSTNIYIPPFLEREKSILYYPRNRYTTSIVNKFALHLLSGDFYANSDNLDYMKMVYAPSTLAELDLMANAKVSGVIAIIFHNLGTDYDLENSTVAEDVAARAFSYTLKFPSNPYCTAFSKRDYRGASDQQTLQPYPYLVDSKCRSDNTVWQTKDPYTRSILSYDNKPLESLDKHLYLYSGFSYTQLELNRQIYNEMIDKAIEENAPPGQQNPPVDMNQRYNFKIQILPTPRPKNYPFAVIGFSNSMPLIIVLALTYACIVFSKDIVKEKGDRLKENFKIIGVSGLAYYLHWFIFGTVLIVLPLVASFALLSVATKLLFVTHYTILFTFVILYGLSIVQLCSFICSLIDSPSITSPVIATVYILSYSPYLMFREPAATKISLALPLCLLSPNLCMSWGLTTIGQFESMARRLTWKTMWTPASAEITLYPAAFIFGLLWHIVVLGLLTWYVETCFPGKFGIGHPWHYPFTWWISFFRKNKNPTGASSSDVLDYSSIHALPPGSTKNLSAASLIAKGNNIINNSSINSNRNGNGAPGEKNGQSNALALSEYNCYEQEPTSATIGLKIRNLTKIYQNKKLAVNNLSLNMYKNQVTCLLGHNGAGKSTTMSMLTGIYEPTKGDAFYYDEEYSIINETSKCRRNLGLCPQTNVLFDELTVREQLYFYGLLKGISRSDINSQIFHMLKDLKMSEKFNEFPSGLSGGMKRKLCVGMAFISSPEVVFLDEPTSGMDPSARRATWDLIHKYKEGRTIMLTTHFMDEADVLGDRIAIMANGELQALGTSAFLKKAFGAGYQLVFTKLPTTSDKKTTRAALTGSAGASEEGALSHGQDGQPKVRAYRNARQNKNKATREEITSGNFETGAAEDAALSSEFDVDRITELIREVVPNVTLWNNVGMELSYKLPLSSQNAFPELFARLDENMYALGLQSYAISCTTLEEVFIKVGDLAEIEYEAKEKARAKAGKSKKNRTGSSNTWNDEEEEAQGQSKDADSPQGISPQDTSEQYRILPEGFGLATQQFRALFVIKRLISARRGWGNIMFHIFLPFLFFCLALITCRLVIQSTNESVAEDLIDFTYDSVYNKFSNKFRKDDRYNPTVPETYVPNFRNIGQSLSEFLPAFSPLSYPLVPFVDSFSLNDYLIDAHATDELRYIFPFKYLGALQFSGMDTPDDGGSGVISDATMVNMFSSTTSEHATPIIIHSISNALLIHDLELAIRGDYFNLGAIVGDVTTPSLKELSDANPIFTTSFRPFAPSELENIASTSVTTSPGLIAGFLSLFGMCFLSSSFTLFVVKERKSKSKHLQSIAGVSPLMYWVSTFAFEYCVYLIAIVPLLLVALAFRPVMNIYSESIEVFVSLILIFLLYGYSAIQFMYIFQRMFDRPLIAYSLAFLLCLLTGFGASLSLDIVRTIGTFQDNAESIARYFKIARALNYAFLIFPNFCFSNAIGGIADQWNFRRTCVNTIEQAKKAYAALNPDDSNPITILSDPSEQVDIIALMAGLSTDVCNNGQINDFYKSVMGQKFTSDYYHIQSSIFSFSFPGVGLTLVALFLTGTTFALINLLFEYDREIKAFVWERILHHKISNNSPDGKSALDLPPPGPLVGEEDQDVATERDLVLSHHLAHRESASLVMENLTKIYQKKVRAKGESSSFVAVNQLSLAMRKGECFGLLGVNGAGKTTTFSMLTGDSYVRPTFGDALIEGYSVVNDTLSVKRLIGYCPQFDALLPLLNTKETLELFAYLKGISEHQIEKAVMDMIKRIDLIKHYQRNAGTYSGGNKRKLSTAISLLGNPSIVFLDEPTSGVDAATRRFLWKIISDITKAGNQLVVLTSHSMEECEALCTRLTIMVAGTMRCLGSTQHLKNKYGKGLNIMFRLSEDCNKYERTSNANGQNEIDSAEMPQEDYTHLPLKERITILKEKLHLAIPMATLCSENLGLLTYELPIDVIASPRDLKNYNQDGVPGKYTWGRAFKIIMDIAAMVGANDFSLSQFTLEQIFIMFARMDEVEKENAMAGIGGN